MFDLVAGTLDRPFRDKHPGATVFSVAAHVIILGGVIGAALFVMTQGLPEVPTMMAFVADMPLPPPPPPPPPPAPGPKLAQPAKPVPTGGEFTFPVDVPIGITVETASDTRADEGVPGGVEGGIPGGIVGGIVGGIITDVAPPPPPPLPVPVPQRLAPVRVGGDLKAPAPIYRVDPIYPDIAVMANATGVVILEATINERGEVTSVVVLRSRKLLDQAAIDAVKQWRYTPLLLNGAPRAFVLTVTLNFSIT
jgi:periplasmic protein TonB